MKCIIVWSLKDNPYDGASIEYPANAEELKLRIQELFDMYKDNLNVEFAGEIRTEFEVKPTVQVKAIEVLEKR